MKLSAISQRIKAPLLLLTVVLLSGCGTRQNQPVEYRTIKQSRLSLPAELTSPLQAPAPGDTMTYGESVELNVALYSVIQQCNIDREAIRNIEKI